MEAAQRLLLLTLCLLAMSSKQQQLQLSVVLGHSKTENVFVFAGNLFVFLHLLSTLAVKIPSSSWQLLTISVWLPLQYNAVLYMCLIHTAALALNRR